MTDSGEPDTFDVIIPDGIISSFCEVAGFGDDTQQGTAQLMERIKVISTMYNTNGRQLFWDGGDVLALHVIVSNHIMNRSDTDVAIDDVEANECVYSKLGSWILTWTTERKRAVFNDHIQHVKQSLSPGHMKLLLQALGVAAEMMEHPESVPVNNRDDQTLLDLTKQAIATESKPGWALIRLNIVRAELHEHTIDRIDTRPQQESKYDNPSPATTGSGPTYTTIPSIAEKVTTPVNKNEPEVAAVVPVPSNPSSASSSSPSSSQSAHTPVAPTPPHKAISIMQLTSRNS